MPTFKSKSAKTYESNESKSRSYNADKCHYFSWCSLLLLAIEVSLASSPFCLNWKVKAFPYSIPSIDPGVQAVSPQVTVSHPPGGRLPLLSARPAVTSPAAEHHRPLADTKLYCLVTDAHRCKQLAQGCYAALPRAGFEPATYWSQVQRLTVAPPRHLVLINNPLTLLSLLFLCHAQVCGDLVFDVFSCCIFN